MPKIKVLDTRQTAEEVVVMSWSPKMDLLALGNTKGHVHLHRLSWQKVWQVSLTVKDEPAIPELMAWHPEGLFLVVASGETTFIIDVEGGKVVHSHEISFNITAARWCTSQYHHSMTDVLSSHTRQPQTTDVKIQRLESNLTILFLGTSNGYVYAYTGGFLLGLCIRVAEEHSISRILEVDATKSLESFIFLSDEEAGPDEMTISFSHFRNDYLPRMAPIIGPLGLKYILFLKSWAMIQGELTTLNDVWTRMVDLYTSYMTFGGTKDIEVVRVDFIELLLTGISSVEMEMFLGSVGREKEAKKNTNVINSANASMTEHIRTIKCSIVNLLTELNEIGGFLQQISGYEEANNIIIELRKACSYLFLAALHIQNLVHTFVEVSLHFMHLIMNTIHSFNIQESSDFIEEDADTDKVLEFLNSKVEKDIFKFLFANVKMGHNVEEEDEKLANEKENNKTDSNVKEKNVPLCTILNLDGGVDKYKDFSNVIRRLLNKSPIVGAKGHPLLLDYSETEVKNLITDIIPTINGLTKSLLCIPVLCSVPFEADTFPIIRLPKSDYFMSEDEEKAIGMRKRKPFQLFLDAETSKTYLSTQLTPKKLLMFEVDLGDVKKAFLKCAVLNFSRSIVTSEIFSANHITVVSYDRDDRRNEQQDMGMGRSILCQIPYNSLISRGPSLDVHQLRSKCGGKSNLPLTVYVDIPVDVYKPSAACSMYIDYLLPIEGFAPSRITVSGPRKVGSLLGEDKRTVLLLEMELDFSESTVDEGEGSDCGENDTSLE